MIFYLILPLENEGKAKEQLRKMEEEEEEGKTSILQ
jgi:hypothetical protein